MGKIVVLFVMSVFIFLNYVFCCFQGKDLFMDLDDGALKLIDPESLTTLHTQPIHTIRVWGVGRDNGRWVYGSKETGVWGAYLKVLSLYKLKYFFVSLFLFVFQVRNVYSY